MKSHKLPTIIELAWKAGESDWNGEIIAQAAASVRVCVCVCVLECVCVCVCVYVWHWGKSGWFAGWNFHEAHGPVRARVGGNIKIDVRWYPSLYCRVHWCSCLIGLLIICRSIKDQPPPLSHSRAHTHTHTHTHTTVFLALSLSTHTDEFSLIM